MAKKQSGLGRGFYEIFDDNAPTESGKMQNLRIADIEPRSEQPRKNFDQEAMEALADSIRDYGVLQPIIVQESKNLAGTFEIVAGERRWRAARMAGLTEIPSIILDGDELKAAQVSVIENVQRENLNPVEEAFAYQALIDRFGLTQDEVAKQVGKSRPAIANMLRLIDLPDEVLEALKAGDISTGHARALLGLEEEEDMLALCGKIAEKNLSVRETEREVKFLNLRRHTEPDDPEVVAGSKQRRVYMHDLERRAMSTLGRKVRITQSPKKKTLELTFVDDGDLEDLLTLLCGKEFFEQTGRLPRFVSLRQKRKY